MNRQEEPNQPPQRNAGTVRLRTLHPHSKLRPRSARVADLWSFGKMKTTAVVAIAFLSAVTAFSADLGERLPQAISEALVRVIAKPQDFVGKPIRVSGVFSWGFEDEKLFLTFDHFAMHDEASAVDLRLDETRSGVKGADLEAYRGFRVKLEGVVVEETPRKEDLELARKAGFTIKPRYHFLFSRLLSYGPAGSK